jgi:hypothetical protein
MDKHPTNQWKKSDFVSGWDYNPSLKEFRRTPGTEISQSSEAESLYLERLTMKATELGLELVKSKCPSCGAPYLAQDEIEVVGYNPVRSDSQFIPYVKCLDCGFFTPIARKLTGTKSSPPTTDWESRYELLAESCGLASGIKKPRAKAMRERSRAKRYLKGRSNRVADH